MLWTQCLRHLSASKGLCHVDWAFTETQRCGPLFPAWQSWELDPNLLTFNPVLSSEYHSRIHLAFSFWGVTPAPRTGAEWCPVVALCSTEFEPKAGATHKASFICHSSTECLPSSRCCPSEKTLQYSNSLCLSGDCPGGRALYPREMMPGSKALVPRLMLNLPDPCLALLFSLPLS